ncbi:DUF7133 domain-containing protein [Siphonobacter aquaeclarae]|uniref:Cytochrome c domain-containing protein n=1 Tax=Siphonobacter aquaeclarae TaxID=563176 RepID=A0A1G9V259_9BACT|nr:hypothetical protein [Siphonobacter aquaeclarae]SDM66180.1 hypothetical protein SAMN04488090_3936 [Siphonobacter aquaeclarae]
MKHVFKTALLSLALATSAYAQDSSPAESDLYKIVKVSSPEGIILEIGGVASVPNGDMAVSTRRGEVWVIENPTSPRPFFRKFASGLHEILGLVWKDGSFYCAQRGELTKLTDTNGDGKADKYETVFAWPVSGHYHEYSFGPKIAPDGSFFVSANVAFGDEEWWRGESKVPYRGWVMKISPDGKMEPWATGMRSPCGLGMIDGELFYTDNQGDWMGSGGVWHVKKGAFVGHPAGLRWTGLPNSPVKLTQEEFYKTFDERRKRDANGRAIKPENDATDKNPLLLFEAKKKFPEIQLPAVWLPHGVLGISNSEIISDDTHGAFGPFAGQMLVGDQGQSKIMRVSLEKVNGEFQGVAFDFRSGFQSGVLRMAFAKDNSLFVGETNRGWGSAGEANEGLQRLVWTGKTPFEMKTVRAQPDGFEIEFTQPIDRASAEDLASYKVKSFIYKYHSTYGSPTINEVNNAVKGVKVSEDGLKARIIVDGLRQYYIHQLTLDGIREKNSKFSLVHTNAYYTLNNIPAGEKLSLSGVSTKSSATAEATTKKPVTPAKEAPAKGGAKAATKVLSFEEIKPLLTKYTCLACHNADKRQVGPAYRDVAKRNYSNEKIVDLIYNPKPENWPGYATPMAPMPQVPRGDALKIAAWINSLKNAPAAANP